MDIYKRGDPDAMTVLVQPVSDNDVSYIDSEYMTIREMTGVEFCLIAAKVGDWNNDLSPWQAPAVYGSEDFKGRAEDTLDAILNLIGDSPKRYIIGGYSLAALFSLWASYQSDKFTGVAAASPSVWFPGFLEYMRDNSIQTQKVYLTLGDKEEKTKNPVMSTVGCRIRECHDIINREGRLCTLEWNKGNHFTEPGIRTAKAFAWVMTS